MTVQPVLPASLLAVLGAIFLGARLLALHQNPARRSSRSVLWRWCGVTSAGLLLLLAALRPTIGESQVAVPADAGAPNVFIVVDASPRMAEAVVGERTRMQAARADIDVLIERYPDARVAVIEFAAQPDQIWPLSADTWSLRPALDAVRPQAATPENVARANAGAAGTVLRYQLISAGLQYPRADNLVFYLGAGAPGADVPQREFVLPADTVDGGAVLGYGTATAGEPALRDVADQIGVPYLARNAAAPLDEALPDDSVGAEFQTAVRGSERTELYWAPAGVATVLVGIELYLVLRTLRRSLRKAGGLW